MYIGWFKNVPDEDKKDRESMVRSALMTLDLDTILSDEVAQLDRQECDPSVYDSPNWDYRQAHKNGARGAYEKIRKIISVT